MKCFQRILSSLFACALTIAGLFSGAPLVMAEQVTSPCSALGFQPVSLSPVMPVNFSSLAKTQLGASCLAWQEFIDLNWQADPNKPGTPDQTVPGSAFGQPGNDKPTVWESYLEAADVFNSAIFQQDSTVYGSSKAAAQAIWSRPRPPLKSLSRLSKLGDASIQLNNVTQADNGWLTSQAGDLAFYEIKLNQDEYEFITTNVFNGNDLTTFAGQAACAAQPGVNGRGGLNLPAGNNNGNIDTDCFGNTQKYGQNIGSIELKASWIPLPADGSLNSRYKIAQAQITDPYGQKTTATVGLTGLHIIHKLPGAPQFIWATFEQIDNSPDANNPAPTPPVLPANPNQQPRKDYAFYNAKCTPSSDPVYNCMPNKLPGPACKANGQPLAGCTPYSAPMQVTRLTPVQGDANTVTAYAWSLMPADSVYNYYRLIDVQWPNQPTPVPPAMTVDKMPGGDITPSTVTRYVANTTMETYVQDSLSCMSCHQVAPIGQPNQLRTFATPGGTTTRQVLLNLKPKSTNPTLAADYSFIFSVETSR